MRRSSPFRAACLCIALALSTPWGHARAQSLFITITPDKAVYGVHETATLNVDIVNRTGKTVQNLRIENVLPAGLTYPVPQDAVQTVARLGNGESIRRVIRLRLPTSDPPQTGDSARPVLWLGLFSASLLCFLWFTRRRKARSME